MEQTSNHLLFIRKFSQRLGLGLRLLIQSETFAITLSTTRIVVCDTKSINCEVSAWLICQYVCYCYRPGSIRADAFRGHGLSLLEKTTLRGLRTRAISANVFGGASNRSPRSQRPPLTRTGKAIDGKILYHFHPSKELCYWQMLYQQPVSTTTPAGGQASIRPRSALSTSRLSSRPRKAKCIRAAAGQVTCSIISAINVEVTSQFTSTTKIRSNKTYEKSL